MDTLYSISSTATGDARNGHVKSADGQVDLDLRVPTTMGGPGGAPNPESLFASGYAACFHGALKLVAGQEKVNVDDSSVDVEVSLGKKDDNFQLAAVITVHAPGVDLAKAQELADKAHEVCPYSRATRGNIDVTVTAK